MAWKGQGWCLQNSAGTTTRRPLDCLPDSIINSHELNAVTAIVMGDADAMLDSGDAQTPHRRVALS